MKLGEVYKKNCLVPVTSKVPRGPLAKVLSSIERNDLESTKMLCAAVSAKGEFLLIDGEGTTSVVKQKDLGQIMNYIDKSFTRQKAKVFEKSSAPSKHWSTAMAMVDKIQSDKKYRDWDFIGSEDDSMEMNEGKSVGVFKVGKTYKSDDGEWRFKVIKINGNSVKIKDKEGTYTVGAGELELVHPVEIK